MATVTGLTAARMQEIINSLITDGTIVGDDLILTKGDGSTVDAGNVRGPKGDTGSIAGFPHLFDPSVAGYFASTNQFILSNTESRILLDTPCFGPIGAWALDSSGCVTVPTTGLYHVDMLVGILSSGSTGTVLASVALRDFSSGALILAGSANGTFTSPNISTLNGTGVVALTAGQKIELVSGAIGGTGTETYGSKGNTQLTIHRVG